MSLALIQIVQGTLSLIFITISILVGILIFLKYFKNKNREFILVGITWILFSEAWWSSSTSFLMILITGSGLAPQLYFLIGNLFIPFGLILWLIAFKNFVMEETNYYIIIIFMIGAIIYEIIFFYYLFTDTSIIGLMRGPIDAEYRSFVIFFLILGLIIFIFTGIIFALKTYNSGIPEFKLRAKFLILAFISFFIGASLDGLKPFLFKEDLLDIIYILTRIVLITASIEFYCGFILPKWIKNRLL